MRHVITMVSIVLATILFVILILTHSIPRESLHIWLVVFFGAFAVAMLSMAE